MKRMKSASTPVIIATASITTLILYFVVSLTVTSVFESFQFQQQQQQLFLPYKNLNNNNNFQTVLTTTPSKTNNQQQFNNDMSSLTMIAVIATILLVNIVIYFFSPEVINSTATTTNNNNNNKKEVLLPQEVLYELKNNNNNNNHEEDDEQQQQKEEQEDENQPQQEEEKEQQKFVEESVSFSSSPFSSFFFDSLIISESEQRISLEQENQQELFQILSINNNNINSTVNIQIKETKKFQTTTCELKSDLNLSSQKSEAEQQKNKKLTHENIINEILFASFFQKQQIFDVCMKLQLQQQFKLVSFSSELLIEYEKQSLLLEQEMKSIFNEFHLLILSSTIKQQQQQQQEEKETEEKSQQTTETNIIIEEAKEEEDEFSFSLQKLIQKDHHLVVKQAVEIVGLESEIGKLKCQINDLNSEMKKLNITQQNSSSSTEKQQFHRVSDFVPFKVVDETEKEEDTNIFISSDSSQQKAVVLPTIPNYVPLSVKHLPSKAHLISLLQQEANLSPSPSLSSCENNKDFIIVEKNVTKPFDFILYVRSDLVEHVIDKISGRILVHPQFQNNNNNKKENNEAISSSCCSSVIVDGYYYIHSKDETEKFKTLLEKIQGKFGEIRKSNYSGLIQKTINKLNLGRFFQTVLLEKNPQKVLDDRFRKQQQQKMEEEKEKEKEKQQQKEQQEQQEAENKNNNNTPTFFPFVKNFEFSQSCRSSSSFASAAAASSSASSLYQQQQNHHKKDHPWFCSRCKIQTPNFDYFCSNLISSSSTNVEDNNGGDHHYCDGTREQDAYRVFFGQLGTNNNNNCNTNENSSFDVVSKVLFILNTFCTTTTSCDENENFKFDISSNHVVHIEPQIHEMTKREKGCAFVYLRSQQDVDFIVNVFNNNSGDSDNYKYLVDFEEQFGVWRWKETIMTTTNTNESCILGHNNNNNNKNNNKAEELLSCTTVSSCSQKAASHKSAASLDFFGTSRVNSRIQIPHHIRMLLPRGIIVVERPKSIANSRNNNKNKNYSQNCLQSYSHSYHYNDTEKIPQNSAIDYCYPSSAAVSYYYATTATTTTSSSSSSASYCCYDSSTYYNSYNHYNYDQKEEPIQEQEQQQQQQEQLQTQMKTTKTLRRYCHNPYRKF